ncbi:sensor domain-containing diguanylate cyclase [Azorhizobium doebereinerae]|uniref:sensor domain-containing diguanylate cyclase n=1 Tax=Azorhizobium doebereinerae TaxID=281091 RepID=UPI0009FD2F0E|nr:sensor domain-containing diguanylate cyclase [Azorhizobium doebereinerae]
MAFRPTLRRLLGRDSATHKDAEATFRRVVEHSADVICRVAHGQFCYVSPSALNMFGWEPQALIGTDGTHTVFEDDRPIIEAMIGRLMSGQQNQTAVQIRVLCGDGSLKWVETTARVEAPDLACETILVMRDITERKRLEEELAAMVLQDGLTGLANRRAFDQNFDREWKRTLRTGGEMALVLLDIDNFKEFNDLYGHQAGDNCLRTVASCISELARRPTDMACRYGGEEVVVVLGSTSLDAAVSIAAEMRFRVAALGIPHQGSTCANHITVSIGVAAAIARSGGSMKMPEGLLQAADHALYKAKAGGRNRVEQAMLNSA